MLLDLQIFTLLFISSVPNAFPVSDMIDFSYFQTMSGNTSEKSTVIWNSNIEKNVTVLNKL